MPWLNFSILIQVWLTHFENWFRSDWCFKSLFTFHFFSFLILVVWFKSEVYTILEYISNLIHISFASNYTSDLSIVLMSAVETFEIWFKSENSYLSSSIWKNEMAAGPALYMSAMVFCGTGCRVKDKYNIQQLLRP